MPRTVSEAVQKGWTLEKSCAQVNGNRYILKGDKSVILIFNSSGRIAGIASALPKSLKYNYPSPKQAMYLKDEGSQYTVNAYFQDPATVCSMKKLSDLETKSFETGDRLVFVGDSKVIDVPLNEADLKGVFSKGGCFPTMGRHYYAHVDQTPFTVDIQPSEVMPVFLLYNSGKLNAFGWIFNTWLDGDRYEHAPESSASIFLPAVPNYLKDPNANKDLSSIHIFLDSTPAMNLC